MLIFDVKTIWLKDGETLTMEQMGKAHLVIVETSYGLHIRKNKISGVTGNFINAEKVFEAVHPDNVGSEE